MRANGHNLSPTWCERENLRPFEQRSFAIAPFTLAQPNLVPKMYSLYVHNGPRVETLDFARFLHGDDGAQAELSKDLVSCLGTVGFVKLVNHGIGAEYIRRTFDIVRHTA